MAAIISYLCYDQLGCVSCVKRKLKTPPLHYITLAGVEAEANEVAGGESVGPEKRHDRSTADRTGALLGLLRLSPGETSPHEERIRLIEFLVLRSRQKYASTSIVVAVTEAAVAGGLGRGEQIRKEPA